MSQDDGIPAFGLYGEQEQFPDILHVERFSARAPVNNWLILPHRHEQMSQLFFVENGQIDATVDGEEVKLTNNTFLYVPERCVHSFIFEPETKGAVLSFPRSIPASLGTNSSDLTRTLGAPGHGTITTRLKQLAELLYETLSLHSPFRTQQALGIAHSVLATVAETQLERFAESGANVSRRIAPFEDLIAQNMAEGWSAADYANALHMTTGHLSRLCRAATGMGAAAYIERRTMEEASRLLAFTQLPVSEVGYRMGYIDPSYFSKRFRLTQGQTPTQYRAKFTS